LSSVVTWVTVENAPTKTNAEPTPHSARARRNTAVADSGSASACSPST
jgi:hypothetical protein